MSLHDESDPPSWLLGSWRLHDAEPDLELTAGCRMEFREGGDLAYIVVHEDKQARFSLRYRVVGGTLHTEHVHGDHRASASLALDAEGLLELVFGGGRARFRRDGDG